MKAKDYEWLQEEAEVEKYQPKTKKKKSWKQLKEKKTLKGKPQWQKKRKETR